MSFQQFHYLPNYQYASGWDRFALRYVNLLQPHTVYELTKTMMHRVVERYFRPISGQVRVLDINCGTGNDFPFFLNKGWNITGTDGSAGMLNLAAEKYASDCRTGRLDLRQGLLEHLEAEDFPPHNFDLIYSVTGGFSYIDDQELKRVNRLLSRLLKPGGRLIVANLNSFCLFESVYFVLKGRWRDATRRRNGPITVNIEGTEMTMFLRNRRQLRRLYSDAFVVEAERPLLSWTPPYQTGYSPVAKLLRCHELLEHRLIDLPLMTLVADQVITVCSPRHDVATTSY